MGYGLGSFLRRSTSPQTTYTPLSRLGPPISLFTPCTSPMGVSISDGCRIDLAFLDPFPIADQVGPR